MVNRVRVKRSEAGHWEVWSIDPRDGREYCEYRSQDRSGAYRFARWLRAELTANLYR